MKRPLDFTLFAIIDGDLFSKRPYKNKTSRCAAYLVGYCLLLMLIFVSSSNSYVDSSNNDDDGCSTGTTSICTSTACHDAANFLITSMNESVDPCDDFYEFACGGRIEYLRKKAKEYKISPNLNQMNVIESMVSTQIFKFLEAKNNPEDPIPVKQVRDIFAGCMNTEQLETIGLEPLLDLLKSFGGWPMTLKHWCPKAFSWQSTTAAFTRLYTSGILLSIYNGFDKKNTSRNRIYINKARSILPSDIILGPLNSSSMVKAYQMFIFKAAVEISRALKSDITTRQIITDVSDIFKFEYDLANIATSDEDNENSSPMYNYLTVTQLQNLTDSVDNITADYATINWLKLLNNIYNSGAGINITNSETVIVVDKDYFKKLVALLNKTPLRTIANYVHWYTVYYLADKTNGKMRELLSEFKNNVTGSAETLRKTCFQLVKSLMRFAISYKYFASSFDPIAKNETLEMISYSKLAMESLIDKADWMDLATKANVKDKLNNIANSIGYPDWMTNKAALESYYSSLSTGRMDFFGSFKNAKAFHNAQIFKLLRHSTDRGFFEYFPDEFEPMYMLHFNELNILAGFFQLPFFLHGRLAALNYGATGGIIGRGIMHGLIGEGRKRDKYGNIANWWSNFSLTNYQTKAQCFIDQYGNYTIDCGIHLNSKNSLEENMADNVAVRQAFRAYKLYVADHGVESKLPGLEKYTPEQLFFLSWASDWCSSTTPQNLKTQALIKKHSPGKFRVLGSLSNNDDFISQFKCPAGSPMNRKNKCILW